MTPRQIIAFLSPCSRAWETTDPRFADFVAFKGETFSTILSLNK